MLKYLLSFQKNKHFVTVCNEKPLILGQITHQNSNNKHKVSYRRVINIL